MREKHEKTNAMRALDRIKADYAVHSYGSGEAVSGVEVAQMLGQDVRRVFKTLVTEGKTFEPYSLIVGAPAKVARTLDEAAADRLIATAAGYQHRWPQYASDLKRID